MLKKVFAIILILTILITPAIPKYIMSTGVQAVYVKPKMQSIENKIYCHGKVTAENQKEIYTDTPVYPVKINCTLGQKVKKGDVLAEIDSEKTINILASSSPIEKSFGRIQEIIDILPDKEIIYKVGNAYGINRKQIDDILNIIKYQKSEKEVLYVPDKIAAPFDGTITAVNITENVLSTQNKPAFIISSCDNIRIIADVPQKYAKEVYCGMKADIISDETEVLEGEVEFIYPTADNENYSDTVVKTIIKPVETGKLKSGYNVKVNFKYKADEKYLTVPVEAIRQDEQNMQYVYVLKDNKVEKRNIETGCETPKYSQIKEGIAEDEIILITEEVIKPHSKIIIKGEKENEN